MLPASNNHSQVALFSNGRVLVMLSGGLRQLETGTYTVHCSRRVAHRCT